MAIEKQGPTEVIDTSTTQEVGGVDSQIIEVLEAMGDEEEIQMQEDGSAILGPQEQIGRASCRERV